MSQISDADGLTQANTIKNETTPNANTAARVGDDHVDLWDSKGNKQEANTWTGMQTFTASTTRGGLRFGNHTADPSAPSAGETYYNTTTGYFAGYQGAWRLFMFADSGLPVTGAVPYSTALNRVVGSANFTFTGGNTVNTVNFIATGSVTTGTGTASSSGSAFTSKYDASAASGNVIGSAINLTQSVASTGVHFGNYVKARATHTSGTINQVMAGQYNAENVDAGTVTTLRGVLGSTLTTNGPVTNAYGVFAEGVFIAGNATVTNSYGLYVTGATVGAGTVTNNFGIFQSGSGVVNEFEGTTQLNQIPLSPGGVLHSGTYTPTITTIANIDATTAYALQYMRVGNVVTLSGQIDADATAGAPTTTRIRITLPVASNFANPYEAGGAGSFPGLNNQPVSCYADPTNNEVILHWLATSTSNQSLYFTATYLVI